jgi:hypothetical protein
LLARATASQFQSEFCKTTSPTVLPYHHLLANCALN